MKYILKLRLAGIEPATPRSLKVKLLQSSALPNELKSDCGVADVRHSVYYVLTPLSCFAGNLNTTKLHARLLTKA